MKIWVCDLQFFAKICIAKENLRINIKQINKTERKNITLKLKRRKAKQMIDLFLDMCVELDGSLWNQPFLHDHHRCLVCFHLHRHPFPYPLLLQIHLAVVSIVSLRRVWWCDEECLWLVGGCLFCVCCLLCLLAGRFRNSSLPEELSFRIWTRIAQPSLLILHPHIQYSHTQADAYHR